VASGYDEFARAIRQKLIREIYPPLSEHQGPRRLARQVSATEGSPAHPDADRTAGAWSMPQ
jgi:hypothetical protein